MTAKNNFPVPTIDALPARINRPLWSVMIPTYNCADYLRLTLESVLRQDPGPEAMQIEVVDDCSTRDDPEAVVREVGQGRVAFFRQPANGGPIANFNTCIERSVGRLIHILHGDDLAAPDFYERLGPPLTANEKLGMACCRQTYIDESGRELVTTRLEQPQSGLWANALAVLAVSNRLQPPGVVIKRQVYERLGGYHPTLFHAADWEMWVRVAAHYAVWYEVEPLALYRVHAGSDTSRLFQTGANMQDRRRCIETFQAYLPLALQKPLTRKAYGYSVLYGLKTALRFLRFGRGQMALVQFREAAVSARHML